MNRTARGTTLCPLRDNSIYDNLPSGRNFVTDNICQLPKCQLPQYQFPQQISYNSMQCSAPYPYSDFNNSYLTQFILNQQHAENMFYRTWIMIFITLMIIVLLSFAIYMLYIKDNNIEQSNQHLFHLGSSSSCICKNPNRKQS